MSIINEEFGMREGIDVGVKANSDITIGSRSFKKGEPITYFDSAKVSSLEMGSNTVWAQGGRGNPNLLAWEGDKTVTFRFEEAVISPIGLQILSGASLIDSKRITMRQKERTVVTTSPVQLGDEGSAVSVPAIDLTGLVPAGAQVISSADANLVNENGSYQYPEIAIHVLDAETMERVEIGEGKGLTAEPTSGVSASAIVTSKKTSGETLEVTDKFILASAFVDSDTKETKAFANPKNGLQFGRTYIVDYYTFRPGAQLSISPNKFAGSYRFEIDTLFKRQDNGRDYPAQIVIPNGKISTAFTFSMSPTGDPTSFPFEVEATAAYDFDSRCKVLAKITIADEPVSEDEC